MINNVNNIIMTNCWGKMRGSEWKYVTEVQK